MQTRLGPRIPGGTGGTSDAVLTTGNQTVLGEKTFVGGHAPPDWGGMTVNDDGSVSFGAASQNPTVMVALAATSALSPQLLMVDYRNTGAGADGTTVKLIAREGRDAASAGPANNLSVIDAFGVFGTWPGTVAAGTGRGRHIVTAGLATQTARTSTAGTYANEQVGVYVINDGTSWFAGPGVRANTAVFLGGADGWEWGIFHEDTGGQRLFVTDQRGYVGVRTLPTHPLTIKQPSNNELGGTAVMRSDTTDYFARFMGGDAGGYLRTVVAGAAKSTLIVGGATSMAAAKVDGVTGLTSPILELAVAGATRAQVRADGVGDFSTRGIATLSKAGTPVDGDWTPAPPAGTLVVDQTANRLWVKVVGTWKWVALT